MIRKTITEYEVDCGPDEMNMAEITGVIGMLADMVNEAHLAGVYVSTENRNKIIVTISEVDAA